MNDLAQEAYKDFQRGMKYKEIAEKYGVSLSAVKSWAARYWKKEGCNPRSKKVATKKVATKRGGQPGNKNAVGHGGTGPPGNKNAVKTGEFEALFFDALDPEERALAEMVQPDKEALLLQEIKLLTVRERRMLHRIERLKEAEETSGRRKGMTAVKYKDSMDDESTEYVGVLGQIQAVEEALTRVQARRQKAIEALHRFWFDGARLELEAARGDGDLPGDDGVNIINDL